MEKQEVVDLWETSRSHFSPLYDGCQEDWRFLHGEGQWGDSETKRRNGSSKPCLTLNQLLPYAHQVVNDIRQARMAIRTSPVDDEADVETADIYQGIIRNIERQSAAQNVYSTSSLNAVGAGLGWIKVKTDYADYDTFDQEIYLERVLDFSSVYIDPSSTAIDGSDAEWAFIVDKYTTERFREIWPDAEVVSFSDEDTEEDEIAVVEFYYKKYEQDTLYQVRLADGSVETINKEQKDIIDEDGTVLYEILAERNTEYCTVHKAIYAGGEEPLEEEEFPSKYIPIVMVIGHEVYIDNERQFHSLIRQAKDAQRMYNYHKSEATYVMALQPKTPTVGPKGSFKSYPNKWASANAENHAFLEYDLVYDKNGGLVAPPQRQAPIQGSPALIQEAAGAKEDIRLAIGMPQSNMGEVAGEVSGIAIRNRQIEGDNATFHFVDNLAASITQVGRILVDMIPRVYSERKVLRIIGEDGEEKNVPVNQPFVKQDGEVRLARSGEEPTGIYNLNAGKYDVVCDVGASYSSKRQETADKLMQLINAKPELIEVVGDLVVEATDLPMSKEIAERIRTTMDPALLGEDPQAAQLQKASMLIKQLQEQLMNYEAALEEKKQDRTFEQNVKLKQLELDSKELSIKTKKTAAEIEKMRAETTGFNMEAVQALGNVVSGISSQVQDMGMALNTIMDAKEAETMEQATSEPINTEEPQD